MYKVFDLFASGDLNGRDWSKDLKALYDKQEADGARQTASQIAAGLKNTKPTHPPEKYAGKYGNEFFGSVDVVQSEGKLRFILDETSGAVMEHRQLDTFVISWDQEWRGKLLGTFNLSPVNGDVVSLTIGNQTLRKLSSASR